MRFWISLAREDGEWFYALSPEEQKAYVEEHPHSKYAREVGSRGIPPKVQVSTKVVDGIRVQADGSALPKHLLALKIPPAWTDVVFNPDPNAALQAVGKDAKGRAQYVYSKQFQATQAEAKFQRVQELNQKFDEIRKQNEKNRHSSSPRTKDAADCLKLIMETGIRPGSDEDTQAAVKAYGATTLTGSHVVRTKEGLQLHFTGKKGVDLKIPVTDPATVRMLLRRSREAGPDGKLFPATNGSHLLGYTHTMDGGNFKTKDFRTALGTSSALDEVNKLPKPKNEAEYKKMVLQVARKVSEKLGNTPTVALQSYINPVVFAQWQIG